MLSVCRSVEARQVALLGSALRRPLSEVGDIDLYILIAKMNRVAFTSLCEAGEKMIRGLAAHQGRSWHVEVRQGPFKPSPGPGSDLQLHLLLNDEASLARLPCALISQRSTVGLDLLGESPPITRAECESKTTWVKEGLVELKRWRRAIAENEIPFRHWNLDPNPVFVESGQTATGAWDLWCLLEGAAKGSDLYYRSTVMADPQNWGAKRDLLVPLLSQLDDVPPWQDVPECWERLREQSTTIIDRRLDELSGR